MLQAVDELAGLLRRAGVRVSTSEVIDASRALAAVGVDDPRAARLALRSCMVKRRGDERVFDELFELYFHHHHQLVDDARPESLLAGLAELGLTAELIDFLADRLREVGLRGSSLERMLLGLASPEVVALIRGAGLREGLSASTTPLQAGFFSFRLQRQLGFDAAEARARKLLGAIVAAAELDPAVAEVMASALGRNAARLREAVRTHVEEELALHNPEARRRHAARALAARPLVTLSVTEVRALRSEVERLARLLRARVRLRPRRERRGRLDVRATLRRSYASDGVPFDLVLHRRRRHKPRLVVLCDISDSVRHVSDFMLQFVYTLVDCFDRVDAFAFVAELGEITALFRENDIDRAIELVHEGAAVNVFANSNYGHALEQFRARHMGKVTSKTTVLIIGDGRSNYHHPNAAVVADLRRRARRLLWLSPEGRGAWAFGDSAMAEYEPHCDRVVVARDLGSLRRVVDELIAAGIER